MTLSMTICALCGVIVGACIGLVTLAFLCIAKGTATDQAESDRAQLKFLRDRHEAQHH